MNYKPDFLIKPYEVHACKGLRPSDSDVYAVIYWFEKMKDGKCIASNEALAEIVCVGPRAVRGALDRLEQNGFIERIYKSADRRQRLEIRTKVFMSHQKDRKPIEEKKEVAVIEKNPTKEFFDNPEVRWELIINIADKYKIDRQIIEREINKFVLYWTEPNQTGKKLRWQGQPYFDVKRRIATWLSNNKFNKPRSGGGKEI